MALQISGSDCSSVWVANMRARKAKTQFYQRPPGRRASDVFLLQAVAHRVVAVLGGVLAEADPAAPAQHRLFAPQVHLARMLVHQQEGAVARQVGEHEMA